MLRVYRVLGLRLSRRFGVQDLGLLGFMGLGDVGLRVSGLGFRAYLG